MIDPFRRTVEIVIVMQCQIPWQVTDILLARETSQVGGDPRDSRIVLI